MDIVWYCIVVWWVACTISFLSILLNVFVILARHNRFVLKWFYRFVDNTWMLGKYAYDIYCDKDEIDMCLESSIIGYSLYISFLLLSA